MKISVIDQHVGSRTMIDVLAAQFSHLEHDEIRPTLERYYGDQVWTCAELCDAFGISHFVPPHIHVIRKHDDCRGTVLYIDSPRLYFSFIPYDTPLQATWGLSKVRERSRCWS